MSHRFEAKYDLNEAVFFVDAETSWLQTGKVADVVFSRDLGIMYNIMVSGDSDVEDDELYSDIPESMVFHTRAAAEEKQRALSEEHRIMVLEHQRGKVKYLEDELVRERTRLKELEDGA